MNEQVSDALNNFKDEYRNTLNNFPQDVQRQVSRYFEIDCRHSHYITKLKNFVDKIKVFKPTDIDRIYKLASKALVQGDRKVEMSNHIFEMTNTQVDTLTKSKNKLAEAVKLYPINSNKRMSEPMPDNNNIDSDSIDVQNINNSNKRPKRNVTKLSTTSNKSLVMNAHFDRKSSTIQNKIKNTSNKKSKVQPTYCICEEISYGDMIGCDNDLCPLEWCHFNCVSVIRTPKGKWYCPFCRGTNSKTMKPKKVFLKELEKYNKRKEEH